MNGTLGVVIVTYNSADVIEACLHSCQGLRVVVVDNASSDDTLRRIAATGAAAIANAENRGFAYAVNQGFEHLGTDFVLLLNPDVQLKTTLDPLLAACSEPGVGAAAGTLTDPDGRPQAGFTIRRFPTPAALICEVLGINRLWPSNPVNRRYRCAGLDLTRPADVEQPAGAFLLVRRSAWERLGGFDTRFHPVWFEDVDFCRRLHDQGLRIRYVPEVAASHLGGTSISKLSWGCREVYWYASLLRYASKHFQKRAVRGVSLAVLVGSVVRTGIGFARRRNREPFSAYARVIRLAVSCAVRG